MGKITKKGDLQMSFGNSENKKKKDIVAAIPNWGWLLISFLVAIVLWFWQSGYRKKFSIFTGGSQITENYD